MIIDYYSLSHLNTPSCIAPHADSPSGLHFVRITALTTVIFETIITTKVQSDSNIYSFTSFLGMIVIKNNSQKFKLWKLFDGLFPVIELNIVSFGFVETFCRTVFGEAQK